MATLWQSSRMVCANHAMKTTLGSVEGMMAES